MKAKLNHLLMKLASDQRGLSTVEYVVLLVLIIIMCVAMWNLFGDTVAHKLQNAATEFDQEVVTTRAGSNNEVNDNANSDFAAARGQ